MFPYRIAITLFCLILISKLKGQTQQDSLDLRRDLQAYQRVSKNLHYDSILYFMPPAFFTVVPRDLIQSTLKNTFENDDFNMGFDTLDYRSVLPLVKIGNQTCTVVQYDMTMNIDFSKNPDSSLIALMTGVFTETFGKDNVRVSAHNSSKLDIFMPGKKMFALKEPAWDSWKFLEDKRGAQEPREQLLLDAVVPREVQDFFK